MWSFLLLKQLRFGEICIQKLVKKSQNTVASKPVRIGKCEAVNIKPILQSLSSFCQTTYLKNLKEKGNMMFFIYKVFFLRLMK